MCVHQHRDYDVRGWESFSPSSSVKLDYYRRKILANCQLNILKINIPSFIPHSFFSALKFTWKIILLRFSPK